MSPLEPLLALIRAPIPDRVAAIQRLCLFDWAACGIAGARDPDFARVIPVQRGNAPGAATLFDGGTAGAATGALINGMLSHALDYDDTHFAHIGHPSVAVLPAIIALAEEEGSSLAHGVAAAATGVEASIRTGVWLGRAHYQTGFHQTATAGAFGATIGAARLLGLDATEARHAVGLCATMASGLKSQFGTMGKPLNAGLAARTGVEAARWAQAGMTSADDGLAGPLGFGPTHHGQDGAVDHDSWYLPRISHKFHACCHGLHAMLEALGARRATADEIAGIEIATHERWMSVCNIATPRTGLEAKFSYAQTAAMRLAGHDTAAIDSFSDAVTGAAEVVALRDKVRVVVDGALSELQARVIITGADGRVQTLTHDLAAPLDLETRAARLSAKAAALLGQDRADALLAAAMGDDLGRLTSAFG